MNVKDLHLKTFQELTDLADTLVRDALAARFQKAVGSLQKTSQLRDNRRSRAQILTVLRQKRP